jgi:uncharacterized membrane protein YccC
MTDHAATRLAELEAHVAQLDMIQQLLLRLMSVTHPLSNVLAQFGANSAQEQSMLQLLDELAARARSLDRNNQPSFEQFREHVGEILPALQDDHEFLRLLIDTLRVDRAAYRELYEFMVAHDWLGRSYLRDVSAEIRHAGR